MISFKCNKKREVLVSIDNSNYFKLFRTLNSDTGIPCFGIRINNKICPLFNENVDFSKTSFPLLEHELISLIRHQNIDEECRGLSITELNKVFSDVINSEKIVFFEKRKEETAV